MNRQTRQDLLAHVTPRTVARRGGAALVAVVATLLAGVSVSGAHAAPAAPQPAARSIESKADLIVNEDSGSRIEELRVGGQTRSIHVQTKGKLAGSYEILPAEPARDAAPGPTHGGRAAGQRVWKLLTF